MKSNIPIFLKIAVISINLLFSVGGIKEFFFSCWCSCLTDSTFPNILRILNFQKTRCILRVPVLKVIYFTFSKLMWNPTRDKKFQIIHLWTWEITDFLCFEDIWDFWVCFVMVWLVLLRWLFWDYLFVLCEHIYRYFLLGLKRT